MSALTKLNRQIHRCNRSLRNAALSGDRHQFRIDRDRKNRARMDRAWLAQQINGWMV